MPSKTNVVPGPKAEKPPKDLAPHSIEWYDRLFETQGGYFYPWKSELPPDNGEDTFITLLNGLLNPSLNVLDIGCGHGDIPISIAPFVKHVYAYDAVKGFIDKAEKERKSRSISNITFKCANSKDKATGAIRMPFEDGLMDLFICRRGPNHWIKDARRVARKNAACLALVFVEPRPPSWNAMLPDALQLTVSPRKEDVDAMIKGHRAILAECGIELESTWYFDEPERFMRPDELYKWLAFGKSASLVPSFSEVKGILQEVFIKFSDDKGAVVARHMRYLWKGVIRK